MEGFSQVAMTTIGFFESLLNPPEDSAGCVGFRSASIFAQTQHISAIEWSVLSQFSMMAWKVLSPIFIYIISSLKQQPLFYNSVLRAVMANLFGKSGGS